MLKCNFKTQLSAYEQIGRSNDTKMWLITTHIPDVFSVPNIITLTDACFIQLDQFGGWDNHGNVISRTWLQH